MKHLFIAAIIVFIAITIAASMAQQPSRLPIRTSKGYIASGPLPDNTIKVDEVPHNGDNVKYFSKEDLLKMLALYDNTPAKP